MESDDVVVVDCGSTKTKWQFVHADGRWVKTLVGPGMNPYHMPQERLSEILLTTFAAEEVEGVSRVCFYGAGCRADGSTRMKAALSAVFSHARHIEVESDLLGAARALCGTETGLACILGTGEGSGLYDGRRLVRQVPSLGYILGDEGSGAVLGRTLVADVLKGILPEPLCRAFYEEMQVSLDEILERVYRRPEANRFLASFTPFLSRHQDEPAIRLLVQQEFSRFVERNILRYGRPDLPVGFVGGVAFAFAGELEEVLRQHGLRLGKVLRDPIPSLVAYHTKKI